MSHSHRSLSSALVAAAGALALVLVALPSATASAARPSSTYISPGLQRRMQTDPTRPIPVIVQMKASTSAPRTSSEDGRAALGLMRQHGRGGSALGIIRGASGALTPAQIDALAHDPQVAAVYDDAPVARRTIPALATAYPAEVGAPDMWQTGFTGSGVTVAVLDSGIAQNPDLTLPTNRIVASVNFADPLPVGVQDPGGHGTHVAGIIGGNGTSSNSQYVGVAPNVNLVDVRVLDSHGAGRASSVIAGLQWVVAHKNDYGIRVVNLSFGSPASTDFVHDPIAAAAEIAWLRGLVVVTAAGNGGVGTVESPGIDPHVITVGALDDNATSSLSDDSVPVWSAWGTPTGSTAKPDVVAPGRRIVSLRVPGSTLDTLLPDRVVPTANGSSYFRLSGTSMATGVISGVAALALQARPGLAPDQLKALLTTSARPFGQSGGPFVPSPTAGNGAADAHAALNSPMPAPANRGLRVANLAAQALYPLLRGQPLNWKDPTFAGINWAQQNWTDLVWDDLAWDNLNWDAFAWNDLVWDSLGWTDLVWDSATWSDLVWDIPPTMPD